METVRRVQWGTQIEVRAPEPTSSVPSSGKVAPVNFAMLYLGQQTETTQEKDVPNHLIIKYNHDYNILEVDLIIRKRFELMKKKTAEQIMSKLKMEEYKLTQRQTVIERRVSMALKNQYEKELKEITTDELRESYIIQASTLLDRYKKLGPRQHIVNFTTDEGRDGDDDDGSDDERQEVISRYFEVARKFIELDVVRQVDEDHSCPGCGYAMENFPAGDNGIQSCPNCGIERSLLNRNVTSLSSNTAQPHEQDTVLLNTGRNNYDDTDTFYKGLLRFQGKQNNRLPSNLFARLDAYFSGLGLPTGDMIRALPVKNNKKEGTSRAMMIKALQSEGFSDCYEDVNLICHLYWGWVLPDISHLEEGVMEDYIKTQKVFGLKKKGKKSSLNGEYRRFKHLELRGYPCDMEFFSLIKTRETLERTEQTWKEMCEGAGLRFIRTI